MKIITIEEEVWKQLNSRINAIADYLKRLEDTSYDDLWLNNHGMPIPAYQRKDTVAYAYQRRDCLFKIYGLYFYTIGTIKDMLNTNAVQSSDEYIQELMAKGKSYVEKGTKLKTDKK